MAGLSDLSNLEEGDLHSFKWEEVMYIWNRQWGEGRSNEKMNGGSIVGKAEKWGEYTKAKKKMGGVYLSEGKNGGSILR